MPLGNQKRSCRLEFSFFGRCHGGERAECTVAVTLCSVEKVDDTLIADALELNEGPLSAR